MEYQEEYTVSDSLAIAYHKIVVIFVVTYKPLKWLGILYFVLHDVLMLIYNVTIINKLYIYIFNMPLKFEPHVSGQPF